MPYIRSMPCFFQAVCVHRWTQIFQGRLCYPWKHLVNSEGFSPRILEREINHVLPGEKKQTKKHTHTHWKKGSGKRISLQTYFSLEVGGFFVFLLFTVGRMYCPPGAQVSWVLQKQSSVLWMQRTKSSATSHGRTSVCNTAWDQTVISCTQIFAGFNRQIILDGIWQAFLTCMCKHVQGLPCKW